MITSRVQLIVSVVADVSLTALSNQVHRGSLANARCAIEEKLEEQPATERLPYWRTGERAWEVLA